MTTKSSESYYLYIDDTGTRFPDKEPVIIRRDGMDCFALGGVLIKESDKEFIKEAYFSFCKQWDIKYPLHSSEIRSMRDNFIWLEGTAKQRENFLKSLEEFLLSLPVIGFATIIHRPGYNERYAEKYTAERWLMCKTAYTILVERTVRYIKSVSGVLHIRYEEAGKKEDRAIEGYAKDMKNKGMPFNPKTSKKYDALTPDDYKKIIISAPKRKKKTNLFVQIADLYLYPMAKSGYEPSYNPWVKFCENNKIIDTLLKKGDCAQKGIKYSCFDK